MKGNFQWQEGRVSYPILVLQGLSNVFTQKRGFQVILELRLLKK